MSIKKDTPVKTPGGIGYIDSVATDDSYLIRYSAKDRDKGLVIYKFDGPCMLKIERAEDIDKIE
jgi:hypothetical protein